MTHLNSRRVVLQSIGAGIALSGISGGTVAARGGGGSGDSGAAADALLEDLATALSVTHKYHRLDEAIEDGYEAFAVMPPVGHIYQQSDYFEGATFSGPTELAEPPSLLFYAPISGETDSGDFDLVLAGMEYHAPGDQTSDPPNLFADEDAAYDLAVPEAEGWHRSPVPDALDVTGLHVWLYLANPAGIFHGGHPLVEQLVNQ